jgi:hypothetical protein
MTYLTSPANWIVAVATVLVISVCIGLHYEVLRACIRFLPLMTHRRRRRVLILIFVILLTHVAEIWLFAAAYYVLVGFEHFGALYGTELVALPDFVYFSAMVYTTVGFGDILPSGPIRFMAGSEALLGLVMITWSASFTFLEMQRDWPGGRT